MLLPQGPVISLGCLCSVAVLSLLQFVPLPCCGWIQSPAATKANVAEMAKGAWIVYECLFSGTSTDWGGQTSERDSTGWSRFSFKEKEIFVQMGMQLCPVLGDEWALRHWHLVELQPRHSQEQLYFVFIQHAKTLMTTLALVVMDIVTFLEGGLHPFLWSWAGFFCCCCFFPGC